MRLGEENATFLSFAANFQTDENRAMGYAVDEHMAKLMAFMERAGVWSDLDRVDSRYYDYIAASIRAPYYSSADPDDKKLAVIKSAFKIYMTAGTRYAVEALVQAVFDNAKFVPWYEYGGKPYCFKIIADTDFDDNTMEYFLKILRRVKSTRSHLDAVEVIRGVRASERFTGAAFAIHRPPAIRDQTIPAVCQNVDIAISAMAVTKPPAVRDDENNRHEVNIKSKMAVCNYAKPAAIK